MQMIKLTLIMAFWVCCSALGAQNFISPVEHEIVLSGSFAEPRSGHFHAGIDIKPSGIGTVDKIRAVAAGQIARVQVEAAGYGRSILIKHDNGYSSLYAHLDQFTPELERLVRSYQYDNQQFEISLTKLDSSYRVEQGELIGYMGNTGYSFGKHLHFEIRRSTDQHPMNPFYFGIKPKDSRPPELSALYCYELGDKQRQISTERYPLSRIGQNYHAPNDTIIVSTNRIQLGLAMIDKMNGASNKNGVYSMEVYQDRQMIYRWTMDEIDFAYDRHMNMHIDYAAHKREKTWVHYCHKEPENKLPIYRATSDQRYHNIPAGGSTFQIKALDYEGNTSSIDVFIKQGQKLSNQAESKLYNYIIASDSLTLINDQDRMLIQIPANALLTDTDMLITSLSDSLTDYVVNIGDESTPLFEPITLYYAHGDSLSANNVLVRMDDDRLLVLPSIIQDSFLVAKSYSLGSFGHISDTSPPRIKLINQDASSVSFEILDNLKPSGRSTRLTYRGEINGQWILFEYDYKNDRLHHDFLRPPKTGDILELQVTDYAGNTSYFREEF